MEMFDTLKSGQIFTNMRQLGLIFLSTILNATILEILNNQSIQTKYQCIYFSSRDGYLPNKIYEIFRLNYHYSNPIGSQYFFSGRRIFNSCLSSDFTKYVTSVKSDYTINRFIQCYINDSKLKHLLLDRLSEDELNDTKTYINILSKI